MRQTKMTDDERRARNREYAARARERKRQEAVAAAEAAKAAVAASPGRMVQAVEETLKAARWIVASDAASVEQVRMVARMIDELELIDTDAARRQELRAHALLTRLLSELAATPVRRMAFELRSRRAEEAHAVASAPNVTQLRRPAKRP